MVPHTMYFKSLALFALRIFITTCIICSMLWFNIYIILAHAYFGKVVSFLTIYALFAICRTISFLIHPSTESIFLFHYYLCAITIYFLLSIDFYLHSIVGLKFCSLYLDKEYYPLVESCLIILLSFFCHCSLVLAYIF